MKRLLFAGALCVLFFHSCSREPRPGPPRRPNLVLVTIDTLRADRLTSAMMPAADRLAARGARFANARTDVPLTLPAHTSILTGLVPPAHGVRTNGADRLSERHPTIGALLRNAGYRTAAFVGAFVLDRRFGLARGFDTYDDQIPRDPAASERLEAERPGSVVVDRALAWLNDSVARSRERQPFFVWIHLYDPHAPYHAPPEFLAIALSRGDSGHSRYDAEVMFADAQLARVVEWLTVQGLLDHTLVMVAGDHGEGLDDHRERTHGMLLYDSTLRVPLVIAGPGVAAGVRDEAVSLVDVAPTILRAADVTPPPEMKGRDLLTIRAATHEVGLRPDATYMESYAETEYPRAAGWSPLEALTDGRWKMIRGSSFTEVYDLEHDAAEAHDLTATQSGVTRGMSARLDAIRATAEPSAAARSVSAETAERLRALGYVAPSGPSETSTTAENPSGAIDTWNRFEEALDLLNTGRPEALALLRRLASAQPDAPVIQSTFARALKDAGQPSAALEVYRRAAKKWTTDPTILHDLAVAAREAAGTPGANRRALLDEAGRAERAALTIDPDTPLAHNGLGLLAIDAQDPSAAAREFERAAALDPNNSTYQVNLGNARRASGDRAGAERAYEQALSSDPQNVDALNGAGVLLVEANRAAEATALFERAVAAVPDFAEGRLNLGIALQQSGQTARAADAYRRVLATPGDHSREKAAAATLLASLGASR